MRPRLVCTLAVLLLFASLVATTSADGVRSRRFDTAASPRDPVAPPEAVPIPPIEFSDDPEIFREQMGELYRGLETALGALVGHPEVRSRLATTAPQGDTGFAAAAERDLVAASVEEIERLRDALKVVPDLGSVAPRLQAAVQRIGRPAAVATAEPCPGADRSEVYDYKDAANAVAIAAAILRAAYNSIDDIEDLNIGHGAVVAAAIAIGIAEGGSISLEMAADAKEQSYAEKRDCLANLCVANPSNPARRGRGCDGVDQDCRAGADDCAEDRFAPLLLVRRSVQLQCYPATDAAEAALHGAAIATDDCHGARLEWPTSVLDAGSCDAFVEITAVDGCGNRSLPESSLLRIDAVPPRVACTLVRDVLLPANNAFVDVGLTYSATDDCGDAPSVELVVTSDEPTSTASGAGGSPNTAPDAQVSVDQGQFRVLLRAERSSGADGRVYRIRVKATDTCGNTAHADCLVRVPLDSSDHAVNDGQQYDATEIN